MSTLRKYQALWNQLKSSTNKSVELTVPRADHPKIIDGLRKESSKDFAFRFKYTEQDKHYNIGVTQIDDWIKLTLDEKEGVPDSFILSPEKVNKRMRWKNRYCSKEISAEERKLLLDLDGK